MLGTTIGVAGPKPGFPLRALPASGLKGGGGDPIHPFPHLCPQELDYAKEEATEEAAGLDEDTAGLSEEVPAWGVTHGCRVLVRRGTYHSSLQRHLKPFAP